MNKRDRDYYCRRIEEEFAAADATPCELARGVHLDLAELYAAKLREGGATDGHFDLAQPPAILASIPKNPDNDVHEAS